VRKKAPLRSKEPENSKYHMNKGQPRGTLTHTRGKENEQTGRFNLTGAATEPRKREPRGAV